ncbi:MAG: SpoIIIAH-like family protein [Bacteroidales bacterium]|nr:SpoIIIAH-like family protein [Lachnoclostridium sp.]MCM1385332.1 SpoIIIAH-like family protein [Lachnoclostridium sp.]MCM1465967.1 SpoIIIAH-like family protein [Bacteroidales bacterium]
MKSLVKKNQLMITALAIMIAIAGYLQFAGTNLEEEIVTVNDGNVENTADLSGVITDQYTTEDLLDLSEEDLISPQPLEIDSLDSESDIAVENYLDADMQVAKAKPDEGEIPGEAVFTASVGVEILSEAKLLKEQTRAKNKETLMNIIESAGLTDTQKQDAVNSMVEMTQIAEKEAAAEILLEAKGFQDVVVSITGDGVDVVVNAPDLSDAQMAQIEDIVTRKTDIAAENIIISTVETQ